ncbi:MAG: 3-phosphoshikimate 1-carboxyvinyltransferase, partial [Chloroflexota bacterium]|nr:3-phosphoshikimate 1-carboxyvinyltransferase [Chloroflexota bacterium]
MRTVKPSPHLQGEVLLPGDKSISHRVAILDSLSQGESTIENFAPGRDCWRTITCLRALGVPIQTLKSQGTLSLSVSGRGRRGFREPRDALYAGNSGTTMRLLSGLLSAQPFLSIITGDASLRGRPMSRLIEPLRLMGAEIWGREQDSLAPLVIWGRALHGAEIPLTIPSAQIKSAILLAGLFAQGKTVLYQPVKSRDHTERLLTTMGAKLDIDGDHLCLSPLTMPLSSVSLRVPGDLSSAAYFLVAGAAHPNARITMRACGINPTRTGIIDALVAMGAKIQIRNERMKAGEPLADIAVESSELRGIEIGGDIIPRIIDELPILAVAACAARGRTVIRGAGELRVKESDRIAAILKELGKMGADIEELADGMIITGGKRLRGAKVDSHSDHRLAMSLAIAGLLATG